MTNIAKEYKKIIVAAYRIVYDTHVDDDKVNLSDEYKEKLSKIILRSSLKISDAKDDDSEDDEDGDTK